MTLEPNREDIERQIELLTQPWQDTDLAANAEIRCLSEKAGSKSILFNPADGDETDEAVTKMIRLNEFGWNCYICVNPIDPNHHKAARDTDIITAFYAFIDADDENAANNISQSPIPPDFCVQTGTIPEKRMHAYWSISDVPCLEEWSEVQSQMIGYFGSDPAIINPSRIMRLAGTISYPIKRKISRGYSPEVTCLMEYAK
jgi:hypothetical protein